MEISSWALTLNYRLGHLDKNRALLPAPGLAITPIIKFDQRRNG
jgi:hypothetical protein